MESMVRIDCDSCAVRDQQCGDCVVPVLLGGPPGVREMGLAERQALDVLADSGLVPRLRLVPTGIPPAGPPAGVVPDPVVVRPDVHRDTA